MSSFNGLAVIPLDQCLMERSRLSRQLTGFFIQLHTWDLIRSCSKYISPQAAPMIRRPERHTPGIHCLLMPLRQRESWFDMMIIMEV